LTDGNWTSQKRIEKINLTTYPPPVSYRNYQDGLGILCLAKNRQIISVKQERPANAKGNAWQRCMLESPQRTKSKLTDPSNWHSTWRLWRL